LNGVFFVGIVVYLLISRASTWYYGAGIVLLCWIGSLVMGSAAFLRAGGKEMVDVLVAELQRRRTRYAHQQRAAYLHATDALLLRIRGECRSENRNPTSTME
jgi:hypothetical protein